MQLTDYEKRMLDGEMGPAEQVAMELLVQQMEEQKKRSPKPLEKPVHKQITPILIRRNTTS